jgi:two-component system NtrC family sensor kinase
MASTETEAVRPQRRPGNWPIIAFLAVAILVPVLIAAALAAANYRQAIRVAERDIIGSSAILREHALKVFETVELLTNSVNELLSDMTSDEIEGARARMQRLIGGFARELVQVDALWVLDSTGVQLVEWQRTPVTTTLNHAEQEYFTNLRNDPSRMVTVSRVFADSAGEDYFVISRPRRQGGGFTGAVAIAVRPDYFAGVYAEVISESDLIAGLVRSDGTILAIHPFPEVVLAEVPPVRSFAEAIAGRPAQGVMIMPSDLGAEDWMTAFNVIPGYNVYVAVARSLTDVRAGWLSSTTGLVAVAVPLFLAMILLAFLAIRRARNETRLLTNLQTEVSLREATEEKLRQAGKMEAVGQLSGGIAHDFNNLLTAIGGNLELLGRKLTAAEPALVRYVEASREAVRRAAGLTQRLLAFSRRQALQPAEIDPNKLVSSMSDLFHRTLGEHIDIEVVLATGVWKIFADANQLESALLNLAINSRDAMGEGGRLTIETANVQIDEGYLEREALTDVRAGHFVLIAVSDTGKGMPPEVAQRAFEPFFTTKPLGEGTGLGLSMVYGFVKQSGGHAKIYSEEGHGTTVRLYLPRSTGSVPAPVERLGMAPAESTSGKGETILVVEDDPAVLAFEVEALTGSGYSVLEARNGREAIKIMEANSDIVLLFTDVVLAEGMNGREVADRAVALNPKMKVLFATGYTKNAIVHHGRLDQGVELLSKPFTTNELLRRVRKLLEAATT